MDEPTLKFCWIVWVLPRPSGVHCTGPSSTRDVPDMVLSLTGRLDRMEAGCCGALAPLLAGSASGGPWARCDACICKSVAQGTAYVQTVDLCALHWPQGLFRSHLTLRRRHSTQDSAGRWRFLVDSVSPAIGVVTGQRYRDSLVPSGRECFGSDKVVKDSFFLVVHGRKSF